MRGWGRAELPGAPSPPTSHIPGRFPPGAPAWTPSPAEGFPSSPVCVFPQWDGDNSGSWAPRCMGYVSSQGPQGADALIVPIYRWGN